MRKRNHVSAIETGGGPPVIESLARGLRVLRCFTPATPSLTLQEIADELDIPKGSAFRVVSTLKQLGFLRQDHASKQYRLGLRALDLGFTCLVGLEYPDTALPKLEELAAETKGSASMAILDGADIVYVARASIQRVMSLNLSVGSRLPCYATSMGQILLAHLEEGLLETLLDGLAFHPFTPFTTTGRQSLVARLQQIRVEGYAVSDQELEIGLTSAAAPVRDASGQVVAAINVSMVSAWASNDNVKCEIVPKLLEAGHVISRSLGYRPGVQRQSRSTANTTAG